MPNALLEAMAAGCGCIGSDAGGIPEAIDNGVNGIILPRWELHRLPAAVLEWIASPAEYRAGIQQAARDRVIADYGADVERRQLQCILERLIPSSS
jgi:glycosyltransferase involved in cell wall biosynthesis